MEKNLVLQGRFPNTYEAAVLSSLYATLHPKYQLLVHRVANDLPTLLEDLLDFKGTFDVLCRASAIYFRKWLEVYGSEMDKLIAEQNEDLKEELQQGSGLMGLAMKGLASILPTMPIPSKQIEELIEILEGMADQMGPDQINDILEQVGTTERRLMALTGLESGLLSKFDDRKLTIKEVLESQPEVIILGPWMARERLND